MKTGRPIFFFLIIFLFLCISCKNGTEEKSNIPIARVYDSYLYIDDLIKIIPKTLSTEDSLQWADSYIDEWIKRELLYRKAQLELNEKQKNVEKEIADYKTTLIIHRYKEMLIKQQLDTVITQNNIDDYYNEFKDDFKLKQDYVKTIFVKIPKSSPDFDKISKWYKSNKEEDLNDLEDYCFQNGLEFNFDDSWELFDDLLNRVDYNLKRDYKSYLERNHYIERRDSVYRYFVNIKAYRLVDDIAPISIVSNDIKKIILNKRKMELLEKAENMVYQENINQNAIEKYKTN